MTTEHADPIFPLVWTSAPGTVHADGPTAVRAASAADLAAGVYALMLRYGGLQDLTLRVRAEQETEWTALDLPVREAWPGAGPGRVPTLGSCRAAVRKQRAGLSQDSASSFLAVTSAAESVGGLVFAFSLNAGDLWSLRIHAGALPADAGALQRIAAHATAFLNAADENPIDAVAHLTEWELDTVREANDTGRRLPARLCIHHAIEDAAGRTPDWPAVIQQDRHLTYRELDEKANALALALIGRGAGVGSRVGIVANRSAEFVVAALAVFKAGAAYVPLDPALPGHRRDLLYRVGKVDLLLADEEYQAEAAEHTDGWLVLGRAADLASAPRTDLPPVDVRGEDLAYVIFTSGSSGEPKGALLDHAGRSNMIDDLNTRFGITAQDRVLVVSSPSFDMSVYDIFGTLSAGATVLLPARGQENDVEHWADVAAEHGATVWHSVPSSLSLFLNIRQGAQAGSLRLFLLGGDWIPVHQPDAIRRLFPQARVVSLGGATEVSVDSVVFEVRTVDPQWRSIPYGRPLANQTAYILDEFGAIAAIDQIGELCLGGAGVGWGYQDRPSFTAERFVVDPFGRVPGGRLYRTGDLARLRPDGVVELIGRTDSQVKVGGVRIELGEIQACLRQHPGIGEAVVVPVRDASGIVSLLAAYLTRAPEGEPQATGLTVDSVRAHLLERLPAPMVPARIAILDQLPVNQNGKVDRRLLEDQHARAAASGQPAPAGTGSVTVVAGIWQEVLGLAIAPGPGDSFYDLGGSSLAAVQVVGRLNRRFGADIKVLDLAEAGTVANVAAIVDRRASLGTGRPALVRRPSPGR